MGPIITDLSLSLSLFVGGCHKKKKNEEEDKVKNDTKQKKKKMETKN